MKTSVSIPDAIFRAGEKYAQWQSISRSALYSEALKHYLTSYSPQSITELLNEIYKDRPPEDPVWERAQIETLRSSAW